MSTPKWREASAKEREARALHLERAWSNQFALLSDIGNVVKDWEAGDLRAKKAMAEIQKCLQRALGDP